MTKKIKKIKNITLDNLARMVAKGFEETAAKSDLEKLGYDLEKLRYDLEKLRYEINQRFDHLEEVIFGEYKIRIDRLEDQVKELQADFRQLVGFKK
jgi:hypothetical protein